MRPLVVICTELVKRDCEITLSFIHREQINTKQ